MTFIEHAGVEVPIICGAMYPCSNPELVAAASEAGGLGIVQPLSLIFVHGYDFREGLRYIRSLTDKPIGLNVLTEQSSKAYLERMSKWLDISLEEGVRFFVTSLGNPRWVVDRVKPYSGVVYHDITLRKWAIKGAEAGVDGLICVNRRAGGHAGELSLEEMYDELKDLGLPLVAAGGVSTPEEFVQALAVGYQGVQMGTRFIATTECTAHEDYKKAIVRARESDIVHTEKISGVPVAVINTPYVQKVGTRAGRLARWLLRHPRFKHWMRAIYSLISLFKLRKANRQGSGYNDYWQAGKSVQGIERVQSVDEVISQYRDALQGSRV